MTDTDTRDTDDLDDLLPSPREQLDAWINQFTRMADEYAPAGSTADIAVGLAACLIGVRDQWDEDRRIVGDLRIQMAELEREVRRAQRSVEDAERGERLMMEERDEHKRRADKEWQDNFVADRIREHRVLRRRLEATMPHDELELRRMVVRVNESGLLADEWSEIPEYQVAMRAVQWQRVGGDGWLMLYAPNPNHDRDDSPIDPTKFTVYAAFGGSMSEPSTTINGAVGDTAVAALVAAIESLGTEG